MKTTRRTFIQTSALAGAGLLVSGRRTFGQTLDPIKNLPKFVAPLPGLGPAGIPVAAPLTSVYQGVDYYKFVMGQYQQQMHPQLPPTTLWGYADATSGTPNFRYLGPAVVATSGRPVRVTFTNRLPNVAILPVDNSLPGAEKHQPVNRASVHLHGGFVPWPSDGGPFAWVAPDGTHGVSRVTWLPNTTGVLTDDNYYPNAQSARLMWYHDHAMGITRLNAYAGLAAPYVVVDANEISMFGAHGTVLPDQIPGIPLVLQDKSFKNVPDRWGNPGDLWYPSIGEQDPEFPGGKPAKLPFPSCVPEFFADTIVINGMAYPELTLPAGVHRFRLLNGTQSRMFNLQLYVENPRHPGEPNLRAKGPDFIQIATEGGFLPKPAVIRSGNQFDHDKYLNHDRTGYSLMMGGAERADVLIDFSAYAGTNFILYNDAPAPFPDGDDSVDYFTNNPLNPASGPEGHGPNTRTMMRIRITDGTPGSRSLSTGLLDRVTTALAGINSNLLVPDALIGTADGLAVPGATKRIRTLNEGWDKFGRLIQMLGTQAPSGRNFTVYGMEYMDALLPEEACAPGEVQVWDIFNTTGDTHPIHFHLVNVQVLGRAEFQDDPDGNPISFDPASLTFVPPDPNERGWKETIRMNPDEVTRVVMRFDLPPNPIVNGQEVTVPASPRTGGFEYVWHCHILEHEEHDMMRPLVVG